VLPQDQPASRIRRTDDITMDSTVSAPAHMPNRGVLRIEGEDARSFLNGLVTNDMNAVTVDHPGYGALLTPQGKVIVDFIIVELPAEDGGGFLLDCPLIHIPDLIRRLTLYKLRARVTITDLSETAAVVVSIERGRLDRDAGVVYADPRLDALGERAIVARADLADIAPANLDRYDEHRITLGVPEGGKDFAYGEVFAHEILLDQLGGVSFSKGCYVGQEVVSRMEHRGTARTRIVPIVFIDGLRSEWEVEASTGGRIIGQVGSTANGRGLAMLRLDKVADAMAAGDPLLGGGLPFRLEKPAYARFAFPGEAGFGAGPDKARI
jgi:folate-binding protein YgfZ